MNFCSSLVLMPVVFDKVLTSSAHCAACEVKANKPDTAAVAAAVTPARVLTKSPAAALALLMLSFISAKALFCCSMAALVSFILPWICACCSLSFSRASLSVLMELVSSSRRFFCSSVACPVRLISALMSFISFWASLISLESSFCSRLLSDISFFNSVSCFLNSDTAALLYFVRNDVVKLLPLLIFSPSFQ